MDWNQCFSHGRFGQGFISTTPRTPYERDFDRLIFSAAFRRLQDKTQVFPLPGPVLVHNRLTHSLEVASVGRSLGKIVGERLMEELGGQLDAAAKHLYSVDRSMLIAATCLAHDIGNPSFGHSGGGYRGRGRGGGARRSSVSKRLPPMTCLRFQTTVSPIRSELRTFKSRGVRA